MLCPYLFASWPGHLLLLLYPPLHLIPFTFESLLCPASGPWHMQFPLKHTSICPLFNFQSSVKLHALPSSPLSSLTSQLPLI